MAARSEPLSASASFLLHALLSFRSNPDYTLFVCLLGYLLFTIYELLATLSIGHLSFVVDAQTRHWLSLMKHTHGLGICLVGRLNLKCDWVDECTVKVDRSIDGRISGRSNEMMRWWEKKMMRLLFKERHFRSHCATRCTDHHYECVVMMCCNDA